LNQHCRVDDRNVDEVVDPLLEFIDGCLVDGVMCFAIQKLAERSEELQIRMNKTDLNEAHLVIFFVSASL
jgi:hypothetical protein